MVALSALQADYEFVIWVLVGDRFRFSNFVLWSASTGPLEAEEASKQPTFPYINSTPATKDIIMNTRTLIAAAAFAFAATGTAMAHEYDDYIGYQPVQSQLTRAEVKAQVLSAQAAGTLQIESLNYPRQAAVKSERTRAEVMAELRASQLDDAVIYGTTGYPYQSAFVSQRSREEVRAETVTASAQGSKRVSTSQN
jgi:hypothetical protein